MISSVNIYIIWIVTLAHKVKSPRREHKQYVVIPHYSLSFCLCVIPWLSGIDLFNAGVDAKPEFLGSNPALVERITSNVLPWRHEKSPLDEINLGENCKNID